MTTETTQATQTKIATISEILYSSDIIDMEGREAALAIIARYEDLMTAAVPERWTGAEYRLDVRANVSGAGSGIQALDGSGCDDHMETMAAQALSDRMMRQASDAYWEERLAELTDLTETVRAVDLRHEAETATAQMDQWRVEHRQVAGLPVETVILYEAGRAGQATNGDAVWGDWDEDDQTLTTDDGLTIDLDGHSQTDDA